MHAYGRFRTLKFSSISCSSFGVEHDAKIGKYVTHSVNTLSETRRPQSTGIKKSMAKERIEPTTYWLGNTKKFQAPARVRTHDLLAGKAISEVQFTRWSGDKVEFWQNL